MKIQLRMGLAALALVMPTASIRATETDESAACRVTNKQQVAVWHAERAAELAGRDDVMLAPGIVADRAAQRIEFRAEATGLGSRDPIEFFLIAEDSGHDYEAVAIALARPQAIYDALRFIGMTPGRATDPRLLQFWPKGERVALTFDGIRAETLIFNTEEKAPLHPVGLVFIGSTLVTNAATATAAIAAEVRDPFSIASNYNQPDSLLDVPWQAPQEAVYDRQVLNPESAFRKGRLLTVVMQPECRDGSTRIRDLAITVSAQAAPAAGLETVRFAVVCKQEPELNGPHALDQAVGLFSKLNAAGRDPFASFSFDEAMPLGLVRMTCDLLRSIDTERGIRIEAPPPGQLFYKAFVPPAAFRERDQRTAQPWELHITLAEGALAASLTRITEHWEDDAPKPRLEVQDYPLGAPAELATALARLGPGLPVIIVYTPGAVTYGQLMAYLRPAMATHPIIHVFID